MKRYNIVALFGKSGSGKDTILNLLCQDYPEYNRKIGCTSRPPRENEKDGIDYNFLTYTDFITDSDDFLEQNEFNGWRYGTRFKDLKPAPVINIGVFNIDGIEQMLKKSIMTVRLTDTKGAVLTTWEEQRLRILPIKIITSDKVRLIHQLQREINPNIREILRRYDADEKDFKDIPFSYCGVYNEDGLLQDAKRDVSNIINSYPMFFK